MNRFILFLILLNSLIGFRLYGQHISYSAEYNYSDLTPTPVILDEINVDWSQENQLKKFNSRALSFRADMGDHYSLGGLNWSANIQLEVNFIDEYENQIGSTYFIQLDISESSNIVSQIVELDFSEVLNLDKIEIEVFTNIAGTHSGLAEEHLRLFVEVQDYVGFGLKDDLENIIPINDLGVTGIGNSITDNRFIGATFSWGIPTNTYFESYDLEVLKIEANRNGDDIEIDWNRAQRIEIDGGKTNYTMSLAQGTGYYLWRIRPIGTYFQGGRADRRNYGDWSGYTDEVFNSHHFTIDNYTVTSVGSPDQELSGTIIAQEGPSNTFFHYEQFDEMLNWIYNKVLTEGSRQSETMTFANGLNQAYQTQTRLFSTGLVIGTQTVYDYSGRPVVQSLPAPTGSTRLGYTPSLFINNQGDMFSAKDFDEAEDSDNTGTLYDNTSLESTEGTINHYYSDGNVSGDLHTRYIPDAGGKPYTRTMYYNDSRGLAYKQGSVGDNKKLQESFEPGSTTNAILYEGSVAQMELDRLFGSEAPLAKNTYKRQNQDENGVVTVSYYTKTGELIATALNQEVDLSNLDNVGEELYTVMNTLPEGTPVDDEDYSSAITTLIVDAKSGETKEIKLHYEITPLFFGDVCDICWTCDYRIEIYILSGLFPEDESRNVKMEFEVTPEDLFMEGCEFESAPISMDELLTEGVNFKTYRVDGIVNGEQLFTADENCGLCQTITPENAHVNLPAGTYLIEKRLYINNDHPEGGTYRQYYTSLLSEQYDSWTAEENCCGPLEFEDDYDCGEFDDLCAYIEHENDLHNIFNGTYSGNHQDELEQFAGIIDSWWNHILNEYTSVSYLQHLDNEVISGDLFVDPQDPDGSFDVFVDSIVSLCEYGYHFEEMFTCMEVFSNALYENIDNVNLIITGESGNSTGNSNQSVTYDANFDLTLLFYECLGYDPDGSSCNSMTKVVEYTHPDLWDGNTDYEQAINSGNFFIASWHTDDLESSENYPWDHTDIQNHPIDQEGKVKFVQIYAPSDTEQSVDLGNVSRYQCLLFNQYPNVATEMMEDQLQAESDMASAACECVNGVTNNDFYNDPNNYEPENTSTDGVYEIISACESHCEDKIAAFEQAVEVYIMEHNEANGVYSPETDELGNSIWSDTEEWKGFEDLFEPSDPNYDNTLDCIVELMFAQCISQCQQPTYRKAMEDLEVDICDCSQTGSCYQGEDDEWYSCVLEYMESDYFIELAQLEREAINQVFQWTPEVTPIGAYNDVPSEEVLQDELIAFFHDNLDYDMTFRDPVNTISSGGASHPISFHNVSTNYYYTQRTFNFPIQDTNEDFKLLTAVTNVIWDSPNAGDPNVDNFDDEIMEINIAIYCIEDPVNSLMHWAYSPENYCGMFSEFNPIGYHTDIQIARFDFTFNGAFRVTPSEFICEPDNENAFDYSNVCFSNYPGYFKVKVTDATIDDYVMIEIGGAEFGVELVMSEYVYWDTDKPTTANHIVEAINTQGSSPNYFAEIDEEDPSGETIIIYLDRYVLEDPNDLTVLVDANMPIEVLNNGELTFCEDNTIQELASLASCVEYFPTTQNCPYGFMELRNSSEPLFQGYDPLVAADKEALAVDLYDTWIGQLNQIIEERTVTHTPFQPAIIPGKEPGVDAGADMEYEYYELTDNIFIMGKAFDVKTVVLGRADYFYTAERPEFEESTRKDLLAFSFYLTCRNTENIEFEMHVQHDNYDVIFPKLSINSVVIDPQNTFNPVLSSYWIDAEGEYIFVRPENPQDFIHEDNQIEYLFFEFNTASLIENNWMDNLNFTISGKGYHTLSDHDGDENPDTFTGSSGMNGLFESTDWCGKIEDPCKVCMRWVFPRPIPFPAPPTTTPLTCEEYEAIYHEDQTDHYLDECFESKNRELYDEYRINCLEQADDKFTLEYDLNYGHYTLYYYDRAGNLIKTVPPEGVHPLTEGNEFELVEAFREGENETPLFPDHKMVTHYESNSIKQTVDQLTPDGNWGESLEEIPTRFWYNAAGQLVLSQDAQQYQEAVYAYTRYDALGRIVEVGELHDFLSDAPLYDLSENVQQVPELWLNMNFPNGNGTKKQVIHTQYTVSSGETYMGEAQQHLRNRVSKMWTEEPLDGSPVTTHFSYDPHGNVKWLIQELPDIGRKTMRYEYDLVSGNVNKVIINEGSTEQFMHRYEYDADNRITEVFTSHDGIMWDRDAHYLYYLHGPLARLELGQDNIQGRDMVYTIEGFLKSINQAELEIEKDPGKDGYAVGVIKVLDGTGSVNNISVSSVNLITGTVDWHEEGAKHTASLIVANINAGEHDYKASNAYGSSDEIMIFTPQPGTISSNSADIEVLSHALISNSFVQDEFAMELGYYDGDFTRTGTKIGSDLVGSKYPYENNGLDHDAYGLYNGNISYWMSNTRKGQEQEQSVNDMGLKMNAYSYDRLNRLKISELGEHGSGGYDIASMMYREEFEYDGNGNIETLKRNDDTGALIDDLSYYYPEENEKRVRNRLNHVVDPAGQLIDVDLDNQDPDNYSYDAKGQLIKDVKEKLEITWNLQNKVSKITKYETESFQTVEEIIRFTYDASGNRVKKEVEEDNGDITTTYYMRDATGNIMSTYEKVYDATTNNTLVKQKEIPLYGSSRLGNYNANRELFDGTWSGDLELTPVDETVFEDVLKHSELHTWAIAALSNIDYHNIPFHLDNPGEYTSFYPGSSYKSIAVAEDMFGERQFVFTEINNVTGPYSFTFFNAIIDSDGDVYIFCNNGCSSAGGNSMGGSRNRKTIVMQNPYNHDQYYIITGGDMYPSGEGYLYYHIIDMSTPNKLVSINNKLQVGGQDLEYLVGQYALAVRNDLDHPDAKMLYVAVNQTSTYMPESAIRLYEFGFNEGGTALEEGELVDEIDDHDNLWVEHQGNCEPTLALPFSPSIPCLSYYEQIFIPGNILDLGELQINPEGNELAINYYAKSNHEIRRYAIETTDVEHIGEIDVNNTIIHTLESVDVTPESHPNEYRENLKNVRYSMDYTPDGEGMYTLKKSSNCIPVIGPPPTLWTGMLKTGAAKSPILSRRFKKRGRAERIRFSDEDKEELEFIEDQRHVAEIRRTLTGEMISTGHKCYQNKIDILHEYSGDLLNTPNYQELDLEFSIGGVNFGLSLQPWKRLTRILDYTVSNRELDRKVYELNDHLGNVRAVVGDKRFALLDQYDELAGFETDVKSWTDYYAFGWQMPGRNYNLGDYRYGFGGHENIDEAQGVGNTIDMGDRWLDTRLGRTHKMDRQAVKFPGLSPYSYAANNPIFLVDPDGQVFRIYYEITNDETGESKTSYVDFNGTEAITKEGAAYAMGTNQFVDDVIDSYNYIRDNNADVENVLLNLATRSEITNVKYEKRKDGTIYDPKTQTIFFNPLSALDIKNDENEGIQSPAVGFFHEAAHRFIELEYPEDLRKELENAGKEGVPKEEWKVMEEFERPAVEKLKKKGKGEAFRKSYGWDSIETWTDGPTSTKSVKRKEIKDTRKTRDKTVINDKE